MKFDQLFRLLYEILSLRSRHDLDQRLPKLPFLPNRLKSYINELMAFCTCKTDRLVIGPGNRPGYFFVWHLSAFDFSRRIDTIPTFRVKRHRLSEKWETLKKAVILVLTLLRQTA